MADDGELTADFPEAPPVGMVPYEVITLEIDGQPVTITVERERSDLAAYGYPATGSGSCWHSGWPGSGKRHPPPGGYLNASSER